MEKKSWAKFTIVLGERAWRLTGFWAAIVMLVLAAIGFEGIYYIVLIANRALAGS